MATCVGKAVAFLADHGIDGEVVVADNGRTDGSQRLAEAARARVVAVGQRGYGAALPSGIRAVRGEYVIMGDADDIRDFSALMPFVERLRAGAGLVMGNRFWGGIEPGGMLAVHPVLAPDGLAEAEHARPSPVRPLILRHERQALPTVATAVGAPEA